MGPQPPTGTQSGTPSIEAMLRVVPGFDELASPVLAQLASVGNIGEVPQGEVLFREGTVPESLYVLLDGRVSSDRNGGGCVECGHRHPGTEQQLRAGQRADR